MKYFICQKCARRKSSRSERFTCLRCDREGMSAREALDHKAKRGMNRRCRSRKKSGPPKKVHTGARGKVKSA